VVEDPLACYSLDEAAEGTVASSERIERGWEVVASSRGERWGEIP
jgi:hypothetical protein